MNVNLETAVLVARFLHGDHMIVLLILWSENSLRGHFLSTIDLSEVINDDHMYRSFSQKRWDPGFRHCRERRTVIS